MMKRQLQQLPFLVCVFAEKEIGFHAIGFVGIVAVALAKASSNKRWQSVDLARMRAGCWADPRESEGRGNAQLLVMAILTMCLARLMGPETWRSLPCSQPHSNKHHAQDRHPHGQRCQIRPRANVAGYIEGRRIVLVHVSDVSTSHLVFHHEDAAQRIQQGPSSRSCIWLVNRSQAPSRAAMQLQARQPCQDGLFQCSHIFS